MEKSFNLMRNNLLNEMKILIESSNTKSPRDLQAIAAVGATQTKETTLAVTKAVKQAMDVEMKKSMEVSSSIIFSEFF